MWYINRHNNIKQLPATPAREKDPRFHKTYREALIALKRQIEARMQSDVERTMELEREIAKI